MARKAEIDHHWPRVSEYITPVAESDIGGLMKAEQSYGDSWKRRGGIGAFMMLARKWDRIEKRVATPPTSTAAMVAQGDLLSRVEADVLKHIDADRRVEGIIDDIRDLRRYLMLVEAEMIARGIVDLPVTCGAPESSMIQGETKDKSADSGKRYLECLRPVAEFDVRSIKDPRQPYVQHWKRHRGAAAFMILSKKWDRIEQRIATQLSGEERTPEAPQYDIFQHIAADRRDVRMIDDIRDLRRYLLLIEAEMAARHAVTIGTARDDREAT